MKPLFTMAVATAAALMAASAADATTYLANRAVGDGTLNLSITTDGALGVLADADILDWNITMTEGGDTWTLQGVGGSNNSGETIGGAALSATATQPVRLRGWR